MSMTPTQLAEHREKLRARGICISCHANPTRTDYATCQKCQDRINLARDTRRAKYKSEGKCTECSTPAVDPATGERYSLCQICQERKSDLRFISRGLRH